MRIVQLNLAADMAIATVERLLDRYHTLTGWSRALLTAGAEVVCVQRFAHETSIVRDAVLYHFVADAHADVLPAWDVSERALDAVARAAPDVVHVNGLIFPAMTLALRDRVPKAAIVLQDHSGTMPRLRFRPLAARRWRRAFGAADAVSFTAAAQAHRWLGAGLPAAMRVLEIPEASTVFVPVEREPARTQTGVSGTPAVLYVGRCDSNKDPATALTGFRHALERLSGARLHAVVPGDADRAVLSSLLARLGLAKVAQIVGPVPHDQMPPYYSAADIFLSASHREGSGYALIESLACGATPCLADIPPFRALAAGRGHFFPAGNAAACAAALCAAAARVSPESRRRARTHFEQTLSWTVIGQRTLAAYRALR